MSTNNLVTIIVVVIILIVVLALLGLYRGYRSGLLLDRGGGRGVA